MAKNKGKIEVYTKDAPGWPIKAYMARGLVEKSYSDVLAYMYQIDRRKEWVADCTTSDIIHKVNDSEFIVHFVIDTPWPTQDRDMVVKIIVDKKAEKDAVFFRFISMPNYMPEKEEYVRVQKAIGYWKVRKVNETRSEISSEGKSTTGGDIPVWLANMFVTDNPYQSIKTFTEIMETPVETD